MALKRSGFSKPSPEKLKELQGRKYAKAVEKKSKIHATRASKLTSKGVRKPRGSKSSKSQAKLKKELDAVFSKYIRQKYADDSGNVACYTCGKVMHWKQIQNGHFVPRQYLATRWHEDNCRPQCIGDNIYGNGKPLDFEEHLKRDLGSDYVEEMKLLRHVSLKLDNNWYEEKITHYKALLKD